MKCPLIPALLLSAWASACHAGGGPENVFVVVNASSPESLAVANAFVARRGIPPINVLALAWNGAEDAVPIGVFRERILRPVLATIDARGIAPQIDCIAYSCGFPWRIDFRDDLPDPLIGHDKYPAGSLTGMTFLYSATLEPPVGSIPRWLDRHANRYAPPPPADDAIIPTTRGFRAATGWGPEGEPAASGGSHHLLAVMLGVTTGRGNTVDEIVTSLEASTAADGTQPAGTIYFMTSSDVRATTRSSGFPAAVTAIQAAGIGAEIILGPLPLKKADVVGLTTGTADFDWAASGSRLLPGAICDNLTSFGGVFTPSAGQTPLSAFIRAGAAGASGTVIEPYARADKFPTPFVHLHYTRGASLAEAFYRSVRSPYQLLVVGDPLCQPWAKIPTVDVDVFPAGQAGGPLDPALPLTGTVSLAPRDTPAGTSPRGRYELFIDGLRIASCQEGEQLPIDTSHFSDGHHELRVVAIDSSPLETQGRWVQPATFANHGQRIAVTTEPRHVLLGDTLRVSINGTPADSVTVFAAGRVLGRVAATSNPFDTDLDIPATDLGAGDVMIHATAHLDGVAVANAAPIAVAVTADSSAAVTPENGAPIDKANR